MIDAYCILSAAVYCLSVGKSQNDSCLDEFGLQNVRHGFYLCAEVAPTPPSPRSPPGPFLEMLSTGGFESTHPLFVKCNHMVTMAIAFISR